MRRFVTLVFLLLFTIPFGISISGCSKKTSVTFCNGGDSGPVLGQVKTISLQPIIAGISLNFAQMGQVSAPTAADCKGSAVTQSAYTYAMFDANGHPDMTIADVVPTGTSAGKLCAGTWNRNTGGGIPDFTTCNPTNKSGTAYLTASADGASSNALPIFIHPVVTSVVLGGLSTDCLNDPATNCSPAAFTTSATSCTIDGNTGCCTTPITTSAAYAANGCLSQNQTGQLAARVFAGTGTGQTNISCKVGHLTYAPQTTSIVSIDQNGVATAQAPGSTIITATIANAGSSAGFFSTCPPTSIALTIPNTTTPGQTSINVNPNNAQPITSVVTDQNGTILTGLDLQYISTTPTTIPGGSAIITPLFPGAASITAICEPPSCNPAPFNQIGLFGNGKPVTSNQIQITSPGINSTVLYMGSTQSLYVVPVDFSANAVGAPVRLPYVPNSMVISNDGSTIYMGSANELMTFNATTNTLTTEDRTVTGTVLAVSPDNTTIVISDPVRKQVYLYAAASSAATTGGTGTTGTGTTATTGVTTTYGGVGTHAEFTPDSQTVYITLGDVTTPATGTAPAVITPNNQLLVHSSFTGWFATTSAVPTSDVTVTSPSVGAFFGGTTTTARGYCPLTSTTATSDQTTTNVYYPDAGVAGPTTDRLAATNDGKHILGATVTPTATLTDLALPNTPGVPIGACPDAGLKFTTSPVLTSVLPGVTATAITGVEPTSDSSLAFITYTGTGGVLPTYAPAASGAGTLGSVKLSGTAIAPVAGVVSADNQTFFVGTSGDNLVHLINRTTLIDDPTKAIAPKLPDANGNIVTPNLLVQRPRKATS